MTRNSSFTLLFFSVLVAGFVTTEYPGNALGLLYLMGLMFLAAFFQQELFGKKLPAFDRLIARKFYTSEEVFFRGSTFQVEDREAKEDLYLGQSYNWKKQIAVRGAFGILIIVFGLLIYETKNFKFSATAFVQLICILSLVPTSSLSHRLVTLGLSLLAICFGIMRGNGEPGFLHIVYLILFLLTCFEYPHSQTSVGPRRSHDFLPVLKGAGIFILLFATFNHLIPRNKDLVDMLATKKTVRVDASSLPLGAPAAGSVGRIGGDGGVGSGSGESNGHSNGSGNGIGIGIGKLNLSSGDIAKLKEQGLLNQVGNANIKMNSIAKTNEGTLRVNVDSWPKELSQSMTAASTAGEKLDRGNIQKKAPTDPTTTDSNSSAASDSDSNRDAHLDHPSDSETDSYSNPTAKIIDPKDSKLLRGTGNFNLTPDDLNKLQEQRSGPVGSHGPGHTPGVYGGQAASLEGAKAGFPRAENLSKNTSEFKTAEVPKKVLPDLNLKAIVKYLKIFFMALGFLYLVSFLIKPKAFKDKPTLSAQDRAALIKELKHLETLQLSVRDRVIRKYHLFLKVMEASHNKREDYLPPAEFSDELKVKFPLHQSNFSVLTQTFSDTLYGGHDVGHERYSSYESAFKKVARSFLKV